MQQLLPLRKRLCLAAFGMALVSSGVYADTLTQAQQQTQTGLKAGQTSQAKINQLDDKTLDLLGDYRQVLAETEQLALYNEQMSQIIGNQERELDSIARQITEIEHTERGILPLMSRMLDSLEQFVALDAPFLLQERTARIALLQDLLTRADVSISEKFRRILEAYQVEVEYGRNLEVYRARLDDVSYDFLRLGRVALYRLTTDESQAWMWHPSAGWLAVERNQLRDLRKAYKVAQQTAAPDLLTLPLPTLASVQEGK